MTTEISGKPHLLHTQFRLNLPRERYEQLCQDIAGLIAGLPGLIWKAWIIDEHHGQAGGVYLFESAKAAHDFANGAIIADLKQRDEFSDVSVRAYELLDGPSRVTRFDPVG